MKSPINVQGCALCSTLFLTAENESGMGRDKSKNSSSFLLILPQVIQITVLSKVPPKIFVIIDLLQFDDNSP